MYQRPLRKHPQRLAAAGVLLSMLLVTACQPRQSTSLQATETRPPTSQSNEPAIAKPNADAASIQPDVNPSEREKRMKKTCQGAEMRIITKPAANADTPQTTILRSVRSDGAVVDIKKPDEMEDYTAVGLGCAVAKADGKPYFIVQYGELPFGCNFCEWFYLHDAAGVQLTHSNPPILTDASLPAGKQQTSNTKEFQKIIEKLGIKPPEVDYIE